MRFRPMHLVYTNEKGEKTYIALYVDDFIIAGENKDDIMRIKQLLAKEFDMNDLGIMKKVPQHGNRIQQ